MKSNHAAVLLLLAHSVTAYIPLHLHVPHAGSFSGARVPQATRVLPRTTLVASVLNRDETAPSAEPILSTNAVSKQEPSGWRLEAPKWLQRSAVAVAIWAVRFSGGAMPAWATETGILRLTQCQIAIQSLLRRINHV
eukprot:1036-Heterococcus_DN1.PRE.1